MAANQGGAGVWGLAGTVMVLVVLNLLSWLFDWGWYFY